MVFKTARRKEEKMEKLTAKTTAKLAVGLMGVTALYYLNGIGNTVEWIKITLMGGLLSIFFFSPLYDLIMNNFTKEDMFLISIGFLYAILYLVLTESTLLELTIAFFQSLVIVCVISVFIDIVKSKVEDVVS